MLECACACQHNGRTLAFERRDWCRISKWKKSSGRQAGKVVGDGGDSLLQARQWRRSGADLAAVLAASHARHQRIASRLVGAAQGVNERTRREQPALGECLVTLTGRQAASPGREVNIW